MAEWIDPKYADIIAALRRADAARREDGPANQPPVRGFLLPPTR